MPLPIYLQTEKNRENTIFKFNETDLIAFYGKQCLEKFGSVCMTDHTLFF